MLAYIARRLVYVIPIVISVALVCFLLVHITPGDPLVAVLPADASQELAAAIACRLRLRPSAAGAVRALDVARPQRRSRPFHRHGTPGAERSDARGRQHRDAGDCGRADRIHARAVVRADRRLFPRHLDRQACDLVRDRRRLGAALLARHGAGDHLLGAAELAAGGRRRSRRLRRLGLGLGALPLSDPAGDHDLGDPDGHRDAHRARADRRYPEPGLCRGAARQGPARDRACSATSSRTPRRPRSR